MKGHFKKSTSDLFEAWKAIKHALLNQLKKLRANQARQQIRIPIEFSGALYSAMRGWVSHEALKKVEEQRKQFIPIITPLTSCTGAFSRTMGLPYAHILKDLTDANLVLRLEHFHSQWHLKRSGSPPFLLEPRQRITAISAKSTAPQLNTRREPSGFELIEAAAARKALPTCSKCHMLGHTIISKACPQWYSELFSTKTAKQTILTTTSTETLETIIVQSSIDLQPESSQPEFAQPAVSDSAPGSPLRHSDPRVIYDRYVAARDA